jgi:predicted outer membrane repeat protein
MHLKSAKTAARTAAIGGILVLGLGSVQAAMAQPENYVACSADALVSALSGASSGDTLYLTPGCKYWMSGTLTDSLSSLTIEGYGATVEGESTRSQFSILTVDRDDSITLDDVNFSNGSGPHGGAIRNHGHLTINGGVFSNNTARRGGAIKSRGNDSSLTINDATFTRNTALYGGAVWANNDVTITGTTFSGNRATDAGAIDNFTAMTVSDSSFLGNVASSEGGAIYTDDDLTLTNVTGVAGSGNSFTGNQADQGGAIYNDDDATIGDSMIVFNAAHDVGGGIYNSSCASYTLPGSTVYGNVTDNIYNSGDC